MISPLLRNTGPGVTRNRSERTGTGLAGKAVQLALGAAVGFWFGKRTLRRSTGFQDRVVFITGGSRGLGFALAGEFAQAGARIALCARKEDELHRAAERLRTIGPMVKVFPCDLRDSLQAKEVVRSVIDEMGGLDVLVNNAGVIHVGPARQMREEDFQEAMNLMFWAPYHCIAEALGHFRRQGSGRIVNIASIGGVVSVPHLLPYCAAKFALVGLSNGLSVELAAENIQVTTVTPGLMRTGSHIQAQFRGHHKKEYRWFGTAATAPFLTVELKDAARTIFNGVRDGRSRIAFPMTAQLLAATNALAPEWMEAGLRIVNSLLPSPARFGGALVPGMAIGNPIVAAFGSEAVKQYQNQPTTGGTS